MTLAEYDMAVEELMVLASDIEQMKRPSYTAGNPDVLHNFKRDALSTGILAEQNWAGHMLKHAAALARWSQDPNSYQSEPIAGRLADLVNYAKLGYALLVERAKQTETF